MFTKFIIACQARTGSTMINSALEIHSDVCCHAEVFGAPDAPLGYYGIAYNRNPPLIKILMDYRERYPISFLNEFVFQAGDRSAVGFKFKFEEMSRPDRQIVTAAVSADRSIKIIFLRRENLWKRYLSEYLAVNVFKQFNTSEKDYKQPEASVDISIPQIEEAIEQSLKWEQQYREIFRHHTVMELTYEQIAAHFESHFLQIQEFLGASIEEVKPKTRKMVQQKDHHIVTNYDEIVEHFSGTEYARFFD